MNLLPWDYKFCSYNCVYCQYGWTRRHTLGTGEAGDLPSSGEVEDAVKAALARGHRLDYITLAGNGEPTVHPEFVEIVGLVNTLRDVHAPDVRTAVLSNSSTIARAEIREALAQLDAPIMKLDAGTEAGWRRFNRPCPGVDWDDVIAGLEAFDQPVLQVMFVHGRTGNTQPGEIAAWVGLLERIKPGFVQVYTLDRPTAARDLRPVERARLQEIASQAKDGAGVSVGVF